MPRASRDRAAFDVGCRFDQLTLQPPARDREQDGVDPDLGHPLGQRHRLPHDLLAFGEIGYCAGLHAMRLYLAVPDQFHEVGSTAQRLVGRARR